VAGATGQAGTSAGRAEAGAERDQWRELPTSRDQRGTSGGQRGARPVARATGRAETSQPELNQQRPPGEARPVAELRSETSGPARAESAETSAE